MMKMPYPSTLAGISSFLSNKIANPTSFWYIFLSAFNIMRISNTSGQHPKLFDQAKRCPEPDLLTNGRSAESQCDKIHSEVAFKNFTKYFLICCPKLKRNIPQEIIIEIQIHTVLVFK